MFTKRHFIAIAATIAKVEHKAAREEIAGYFVKTFAADNPNFKRERFLDACGVSSEPVDQAS